jgi:replicative DNA helicase
VSDVLETKYFEADTNKWIVDKTIKYFQTYKNTPTTDYFKTELQKVEDKTLKQNVALQLKAAYSEQNSSDKEWVKTEFITFCKNQNFKTVILTSVELLKTGQYDKIERLVKDAAKVGQVYDLGLDYKEDIEARFEDVNRKTVATGWDVIDELMGGGLGPGELGVVVAPSGVGKCVGADTEIEIEYEEIGIETINGQILWFKPWETLRLNNGVTMTAATAEKIITTFGVGKTI